MAHPHTVHLPLGALLIWRTLCGYRCPQNLAPSLAALAAQVRRVRALVASHDADVLVLGSLIFYLKWLRTLGLPLVHTRLAPYAAAPGESSVVAHAKDVVHFLSIGRCEAPTGLPFVHTGVHLSCMHPQVWLPSLAGRTASPRA